MIKEKQQIKVLRSIALISLGFAALMSLLVIVNYLQLNRIDPVNTEIINALVDRLNENPSDMALRQEIRELDLLARKAYFTNRWQVRNGAYIILISLAIFVIIYQLLIGKKRQEVIADPDAPRDILGIKKNARIGISIAGGIFIFTALLLNILTQNRMKFNDDKISQEALVELETSDEKTIDVANEETKIENSEKLIDTLGSNPDKETLIEQENEKANSQSITEEVDNKVEVKKEEEIQAPFPSAKELRENAPYFRGHNGNGKVYQSNVPLKWNGTTGENIVWKSSISIQSYNSPIVWEDKIFLSGANEENREVYCYAKSDGKLLWSTKITGIPGSPAVAPKTTSDTGLGASTMTTDGRRVYAIFGTGDLVALDMEGNIIWGKNLGVPQNHYGHSSSLLMHQQKLIVQYDQKKNGKLMAFQAEDGKQIWSTPRTEKISWASPLLVYHENKSQIILVSDPNVASYDPWTGKQIWSIECISGEVGPSACFDDGIVYAVNDYANIAAIDLNDPSGLLWEDADVLSDIPSPVANNGLLLMPTSYGVMACYDGKNGEILWEHEFDDNIFSSPMMIGDLVYLMDTKGVMHIFKLKKEGFQSIAENPLGEDAVCTPAFADGRIYIRTDKTLYCIGK